ncbi:MAG: Mut7-C RNAse domain-containing protein [Thermodesulfobacteriota bacterium]
MNEAAPRFLVDAMLGSVARDLRLLGYDAEYAGSAPDAALLGRCQREGRVLVTRDRELARRAGPLPHVAVEAPAPQEQTREVLRAIADRPAPAPFTRCLACNGILRAVSREAARAALPDHVAHAQERFLSCDRCDRTYWEGTHMARLQERLARLAGRGA